MLIRGAATAPNVNPLPHLRSQLLCEGSLLHGSTSSILIISILGPPIVESCSRETFYPCKYHIGPGDARQLLEVENLEKVLFALSFFVSLNLDESR